MDLLANSEDQIIVEISQLFHLNINKIIVGYVGVSLLFDDFRAIDKNSRKYKVESGLENYLEREQIDLINNYDTMLFKDIFSDKFEHNIVYANQGHAAFLSDLDDKCLIKSILDNKYWHVDQIKEVRVSLEHANTSSYKYVKKSARFDYKKCTFVSNLVLCFKVMTPHSFVGLGNIINRVELIQAGDVIDTINGNVFDVLYKMHDLSYKVTEKSYKIYDYEIPLPFDCMTNDKGMLLVESWTFLIKCSFPNTVEVHDSYLKYNEISIIPKDEILPERFDISIIRERNNKKWELVGDQSSIDQEPGLCEGLHQDQFYDYQDYEIFSVCNPYFIVIYFTNDIKEVIIDKNLLDCVELYLDNNVIYESYKPLIIEDLKGKFIVPLCNLKSGNFEDEMSNLINFCQMEENTLRIYFNKKYESYFCNNKIRMHMCCLTANGIKHFGDNKFNNYDYCDNNKEKGDWKFMSSSLWWRI